MIFDQVVSKANQVKGCVKGKSSEYEIKNEHIRIQWNPVNATTVGP